MNILINIIISCFLISLISLSGIFILIFKKKTFNDILLPLVALSAGTLIGGAILHLIPESIEQNNSLLNLLFIIFGFSFFFIIEMILQWINNKNKNNKKKNNLAFMNLLGDFIHNFIDGLVIAATFINDFSLGITTSIIIALHEIPQELGDFGVLIYSGLKLKKTLLLNFITALTAILGGIVGFYLINYIKILTPFLLSFAAGGFIYISASDLIPELKEEKNIEKTIINSIIFSLGILFMLFVKLL